MATAPIKSQPLHNFSLPHLKWAHKNPHQPQLQQHSRHSTVNRFRRRDSPEFDDSTAKLSSRTNHKPQPISSSFSSASHQNQKAEQSDDVAEESEKPWNLRPRKVGTTTATLSFMKSEREKEKLLEEKDETRNNNNNNNNNNGSSVLLKSSSSSRLRGSTAFGGVVGGGGLAGQPGFYYGTERQQRKVVEEKRKLWISLSKEEIEEDVYSLTGSRPSRRPKKRPRNVQKQLDNLFPGLYFVGMSVDSYRCHDSLR